MILHLISLEHVYGCPLAKFECVLVEEKMYFPKNQTLKLGRCVYESLYVNLTVVFPTLEALFWGGFVATKANRDDLIEFGAQLMFGAQLLLRPGPLKGKEGQEMTITLLGVSHKSISHLVFPTAALVIGR